MSRSDFNGKDYALTNHGLLLQGVYNKCQTVRWLKTKPQLI